MIAGLLRGESVSQALDGANSELRRHSGHDEVTRAIDAASMLAARGRPSPEQLESLGAGWVAEEAISIAICCALVANDFRDGVLLAVNHSGDRSRGTFSVHKWASARFLRAGLRGWNFAT
jgi:ADP-ribosyl-[dinitrogen reductase] hydrolase